MLIMDCIVPRAPKGTRASLLCAELIGVGKDCAQGHDTTVFVTVSHEWNVGQFLSSAGV